MNMNSLVSCFGTALRGFFEFCEKQNGVKADELNTLFNQYFTISGSDAALVVEAVKKSPSKKTAPKKTVKNESDESDDEDTSSAKKDPAKEAPKGTARKPSGKGKEPKPRDEHTPVTDIDMNKKKLPELKEYARERGLPVSGTKAQLIENIFNYEKEQQDSPADKLDSIEQDLSIQIKKPKTKGVKTFEPADKPKYEVEDKHGAKMIYSSKQDGWFVLNANNVVVGWVHSDDEANAEEDESVDIRALDKEACKMAKELGLEFEVPENLE